MKTAVVSKRIQVMSTSRWPSILAKSLPRRRKRAQYVALRLTERSASIFLTG